RVGEATLGPMLLDDDVARLRHEVGMPLAAPATLREGLQLLYLALAGIHVIPAFIIAGLPTAMGNEEDFDAGRAGAGDNRAQVIEQSNLIGDALHHRPDLAAFRQEVVVGIDQQ